jgi:hypothetical protein
MRRLSPVFGIGSGIETVKNVSPIQYRTSQKQFRYTAGLEIYLDDLHLSTGGNIHADGQRSARLNGPSVLSVKIRKDEPFVLDFATRPEVLFACPKNTYRIARGQDLRVEAVLVDPKLDLMVTDLERGRRVLEAPDENTLRLTLYGTGAGLVVACGFWLLSYTWRSRKRILLVPAGLAVVAALVPPIILYTTNIEYNYSDMAPEVTIARSNGQIVASGSMPFG